MLEGLWLGGRPHTHIFWDCPKLLRYWLNIQIEIKKCLNVNLPFKPSCFVLGILPDDLENYNQRILLLVFLLIAKKMITISWLRPQPPTVTQWREKVKDVYYMENITARLHLKIDVFLNRWSPNTSYFIKCNDSCCVDRFFLFFLFFCFFVPCHLIMNNECLCTVCSSSHTVNEEHCPLSRTLSTLWTLSTVDIVRMSKSMDYLHPIYTCVVPLNMQVYMTAPEKGK